MTYRTTPPSDHLAEASHAEQAGDLPAAVAHLRSHLRHQPADGPTRLRLGRLLLALDEPKAARQVLAELDEGVHASAERPLAERTNRLLALLDEREGALASAEIRWERILAADIDDPEARGHLRALHPRAPRGPRDLSLGTLVAPAGVRTSRFRLLRELGRGATATVYLVQDERLELPLALKVLHPYLAGVARTEARVRFFNEARVAARLRHPGVVAVYDLDEATRSLVMEYVPGGTLRARIRDTAAAGIPPREMVALARSLLAALAYVHGAGVVHGDLKPGNVLLRARTEAVLADFGGARLAGTTSTAQGTPLYLAPEQFHGAPASPRTDLFAAGAILWEVATGQPARRPGDLLFSPETLAPSLPEISEPVLGSRLRALIIALVAPTPEQRPTSAAEALAALTP
ncbi:MAG TPA: serine/threonine-protein kinase [Polyangia bacterium]